MQSCQGSKGSTQVGGHVGGCRVKDSFFPADAQGVMAQSLERTRERWGRTRNKHANQTMQSCQGSKGSTQVGGHVGGCRVKDSFFPADAQGVMAQSLERTRESCFQ